MQPLASLTYAELIATKRGENIYFVSGMASDGKPYNACVLSTPEQMDALHKDVEKLNMPDSLLSLAFNGATLQDFLGVSERMLLKLDHYGKILVWNYGDVPDKEMLGYLKNAFNLEIIPPK